MYWIFVWNSMNIWFVAYSKSLFGRAEVIRLIWKFYYVIDDDGFENIKLISKRIMLFCTIYDIKRLYYLRDFIYRSIAIFYGNDETWLWFTTLTNQTNSQVQKRSLYNDCLVNEELFWMIRWLQKEEDMEVRDTSG